MRRPPTRPKRPGLYPASAAATAGQSPVNGAEKRPSTAKMGRLVARVSPTFAIPRSLLGVPCFPSGTQGPALRKHVLLTFAAPPACFREQHAEAWHRRMKTCHRPSVLGQPHHIAPASPGFQMTLRCFLISSGSSDHWPSQDTSMNTGSVGTKFSASTSTSYRID